MALGLCFLAPSLLRLADVFHQHDEKICQMEGKVHFHKTKVVCDFQKIKLTSNYYPPMETIGIYTNTIVREKLFSFGHSFKPTFELHYALRAPPFFS